jgi:hypothetical protein
MSPAWAGTFGSQEKKSGAYKNFQTFMEIGRHYHGHAFIDK